MAHYVFNSLEDLSDFIHKNKFSIEKVYFSSVLSNENNQNFLSKLSGFKVDTFTTDLRRIPFNVNYNPIEKLGTDRILAVLGAYFLYPENDFMVVDAGTCLKYGYFSKSEGFLGGFISPALRMRIYALHTNTMRLPVVEIPCTEEVKKTPFGTNTESSILGGVLLGIAGEMEKMISIGIKKLNSPVLIFTGGDYEYLISLYSASEQNPLLLNKNKIFAEPFLIHYGLKYFIEKIEK
jgi:pantothenate kinase type III